MSAHPKSSLCRRRDRLAAAAIGAITLLLVACDQQAADQRVATPGVALIDSVVEDSIAEVARRSTYDPDLGELLVVPVFGDDGAPDQVAILSPLRPGDVPVDDTVGLADRLGSGRVLLLSRAGERGEGVLRWERGSAAASSDSLQCAVWPHGLIAVVADSTRPTLGAGRAMSSWSVAVPVGRVTGLALDSIESVSSRDSSDMAVNFSRLASALPEDSTSPFRGLPFTVTRAYRLRATDAPFVMGVLVRRIPQEDRPLEERLLILASLPTVAGGEWTEEWFERTSGREEEVIATEPLAVVRTAPDRSPLVILGRDDGTGTALALLERRNGRWSVRWESPVSGC